MLFVSTAANESAACEAVRVRPLGQAEEVSADRSRLKWFDGRMPTAVVAV